MTTASSAYAIIKARLEAGGLNVPLRWQNEDADSHGNNDLPNNPTSFIYCEFLAEGGELASFGGGRGNNRWRNRCRIDAYVFVPRGVGLSAATDLAESVAALFRSYRDADISCFDATVYPGGQGSQFRPAGVASEVDNYFVAVAEVRLFYDLIG